MPDASEASRAWGNCFSRIESSTLGGANGWASKARDAKASESRRLIRRPVLPNPDRDLFSALWNSPPGAPRRRAPRHHAQRRTLGSRPRDDRPASPVLTANGVGCVLLGLEAAVALRRRD